MKPVLLTPSKAASLADAYRQFNADPNLEGRVEGLTRIECYKLFKIVSLFYGQRDEDLALSFLDKIADGKINLIEASPVEELHDEKLVAEHNQLVEQTIKETKPERLIYRSPSPQESPGKETKTEEKPKVVDEIRVWAENRARTKLEAYLRKQGFSEERAKVYSQVGAKRIAEQRPAGPAQRSFVQTLVKDLVSELDNEQVSAFVEEILNIDSAEDEKSMMGSLLASFKQSSVTPRKPRSYVTSVPAGTVAGTGARAEATSGTSAAWKQTLIRLEHQPLSPWRQFFSDIRGEILGAKLSVLEKAKAEFLNRHPEFKDVEQALVAGYSERDVLKEIDHTKPLRFTTEEEAREEEGQNGSLRVLNFKIERPSKGAEGAEGERSQVGRVTIRRALDRVIDRGKKEVYKEARRVVWNEAKGAAARGARSLGTRVFGGFARGASSTALRTVPTLAGRVAPALGGFFTSIGAAAGSIGGGTILAVVAVVIVVVIVVLVVISFMADASDTALYVSEGSPTAIVQSEYIDLTYTVAPSVYKEDPPLDPRFTIVVTAKKNDLTNITVEGSFGVLGTNSNPPVPTSPNITLSPELKTGASEIAEYQIHLGPDYKDSIVTSILTVTADVVGGPQAEKAVTSVSVMIGVVPTACLNFIGPWTDAERTLELGAVGVLSRSPAFMGGLCAGGTEIKVTRDHSPTDLGGRVTSDNDIIIYNNGLLNSINTLYTLAHEAGHIYDRRNKDSLRDFVKSVTGEGFLPTYPFGKSESEDYAETIADYVVWRTRTFYSEQVGGYKLNMKDEFPGHYNFARDMIFNGVEY